MQINKQVLNERIKQDNYQKFSLLYNPYIPKSLILLKNKNYVHCLFDFPYFILYIPNHITLQQYKDQNTNNLKQQVKIENSLIKNKDELALHNCQNLVENNNSFNQSLYLNCVKKLIKLVQQKYGVKIQICKSLSQINIKIQNIIDKDKVILQTQIQKSLQNIHRIGVFIPLQYITTITPNIDRNKYINNIYLFSLQQLSTYADENVLNNIGNNKINNNGPQNNELQFIQLKNNNFLSQKMKFTQSIMKVIEQTKANSYYEKITPNFVSLATEVGNANDLKLIISYMIKQRLFIDRKTLFLKFIQLAKQINTQDQLQGIQNLIDAYQNVNYTQLKPKHIISLYTDESFLHRFINKIMRTSCDPKQIFYIAPIFTDIFLAIQQLYKTQQIQVKKSKNIANVDKNIQNYKNQFVCYRGAYFSQKQIQNFINYQGECVECLGFLSTTEIYQKAIQLATNTLIVIKVNNVLRDQQTDYGFAFIQQYSFYYQQKQVLFNPLNSFKVEKVEKQKQIGVDGKKLNRIVLQYGVLSEAIANKKNNDQANYKYNKLCNISEKREKLFYNSNILYVQGQLLFKMLSVKTNINNEQGIKYWQKMVQLQQNQYKNKRQKYLQLAAAYQFYGFALINIGQNNNANIQIRKSLTIIQQNQGTNTLNYANYLSDLHLQIYKVTSLQLTQQMLNKQICIVTKYYGQNSIQILLHLLALIKYYLKFDKYKQAKQTLSKIQQIYKLNENINNHAQQQAIWQDFIYFYFVFGNRQKSLYYTQKCLKLRQQNSGKQSLNYLAILNNAVTIYAESGKYYQAYIGLKQCLKIRKKLLGLLHIQHLRNLLQIAHCLQMMNLFQQAFIYLQEFSKLLLLKSDQQKNNIYVEQLFYTIRIIAKSAKMEKLKQQNGNWIKKKQQWKQKYNEYKKKVQQIYGKNTVLYAKSFIKLSQTYLYIQQLFEGIKMYEISLKILQKQNYKGGNMYIQALSNIGTFYFQLNDNQKAFTFLNQGLELSKQLFTQNSTYYMTFLHQIGIGYFKTNQYEKALLYFHQSYYLKCKMNDKNQEFNNFQLIQISGLKLNKNVFSVDSIISLLQIGKTYNQLGWYQQSLQVFNHCLQCENKFCIRNKQKQHTQLFHQIIYFKTKVEQNVVNIKYFLQQTQNNKIIINMKQKRQAKNLIKRNRQQEQKHKIQAELNKYCYIDFEGF